MNYSEIAKAVLVNAGALASATMPIVVKQYAKTDFNYQVMLEREVNKINKDACNLLIKVSRKRRLEVIREEEAQMTDSGAIRRKSFGKILDISSSYQFRCPITKMTASLVQQIPNKVTATKFKIAADASQNILLDVLRDIYYPQYGFNNYTIREDREFANSLVRYIDERLPLPFPDTVVNDLKIYDPTISREFDLYRKHMIILSETDEMINLVKAKMPWAYEDMVQWKLAQINGTPVNGEKKHNNGTNINDIVSTAKDHYVEPFRFIAKTKYRDAVRFLKGDDYKNDNPDEIFRKPKKVETQTEKLDWKNYKITPDTSIDGRLPSDFVKFILGNISPLYPDFKFGLSIDQNTQQPVLLITKPDKTQNALYIDDGTIFGGRRPITLLYAVNAMGNLYFQPIDILKNPEIAKKGLLNAQYILTMEEKEEAAKYFGMMDIYDNVDFRNTAFINDIDELKLNMFYNRIESVVVSAKMAYGGDFVLNFGKLAFEEYNDEADFTLSSPGGVSFACREDKYINKSSIITNQQQMMNQAANMPPGMNVPMFTDQIMFANQDPMMYTQAPQMNGFMPAGGQQQYVQTGFMKVGEEDSMQNPQMQMQTPPPMQNPQMGPAQIFENPDPFVKRDIVPPEEAGAKPWPGIKFEKNPQSENNNGFMTMDDIIYAIGNEVYAIMSENKGTIPEKLIEFLRDKYKTMAENNKVKVIDVDNVINNAINLFKKTRGLA